MPGWWSGSLRDVSWAPAIEFGWLATWIFVANLLPRSIQQYVLIEQDRMAARVLVRGPAEWRGVSVGANLALPEANVALPLSAIYGGVRLPHPQD